MKTNKTHSRIRSTFTEGLGFILGIHEIPEILEMRIYKLASRDGTSDEAVYLGKDKSGFYEFTNAKNDFERTVPRKIIINPLDVIISGNTIRASDLTSVDKSVFKRVLYDPSIPAEREEAEYLLGKIRQAGLEIGVDL